MEVKFLEVAMKKQAIKVVTPDGVQWCNCSVDAYEYASKYLQQGDKIDAQMEYLPVIKIEQKQYI